MQRGGDGMQAIQVLFKTGVLFLCVIGLFVYAIFYWGIYLLKRGKNEY